MLYACHHANCYPAHQTKGLSVGSLYNEHQFSGRYVVWLFPFHCCSPHKSAFESRSVPSALFSSAVQNHRCHQRVHTVCAPTMPQEAGDIAKGVLPVPAFLSGEEVSRCQGWFFQVPFLLLFIWTSPKGKEEEGEGGKKSWNEFRAAWKTVKFCTT